MTVLCYSKCSTCKKALRWLDEQGAVYTLRDIQQENPTYDELKAWYAASGLPLKRFFNTSGQIYRAQQLSRKLPTMEEEEQLCLLATDGLLVKRPLLVNGDTILTGFREAEWEQSIR